MVLLTRSYHVVNYVILFIVSILLRVLPTRPASARALIAQALILNSPCSVVGSKIVHCTLEKAAMERALPYVIALACLMTRPVNQAIAVRGKSTVSVVHVCA